MSKAAKRTVTASLLIAAGVAVLIALVLAGARDEATASRVPDPPKTPISEGGKIKITVVSDPAKKPDQPVTMEQEPPPKPPEVDVVFVLDTTGSMDGLISGAKKKIWAIANMIVSGQPRPDVRIGLIGYRDKGDIYVTRRYQLAENMDDVYARLRRFRADGGGDTPEHVNRALFEAIHRMQWREGQGVLRMVFLVGDSPPHEGLDGLYSHRLARQAASKGIVINTVRCGTMDETGRIWTRIASASGGLYTSIRQDGGMVAMRTPVDDRLTELNRALSLTLLPTGGTEEKTEARRRATINAAMAAPVQAESAKYRAISGKLDSSDLLDKVAKGKDLDTMRDEELPSEVASLSRPARKAYVKSMARRRAALKSEIMRLAGERDAYIKARRPSAANAFDDKVVDALKAQGAKAGIAY